MGDCSKCDELAEELEGAKVDLSEAEKRIEELEVKEARCGDLESAIHDIGESVLEVSDEVTRKWNR